MDIQQNQSGVFPKFYLKPIQDQKRSDEEGRPIFREVEYLEIRVAGDNTTVIERKVRDEDRQRWPQIYEAFRRNQEQVVDGTPISEWPALTVGRIAELKALNIHTVEALAELPDGSLKRLGMDGRDLQAKAQAYLDKAKDSAIEQKQAKQIKHLEDQVEFLKNQIRELGEAPKEKPRRGRKPKTETTEAA